MPVKHCLKKCDMNDFHNPDLPFVEEQFEGDHTDWGNSICDWCAGMWDHMCSNSKCTCFRK